MDPFTFFHLTDGRLDDLRRDADHRRLLRLARRSARERHQHTDAG